MAAPAGETARKEFCVICVKQGEIHLCKSACVAWQVRVRTGLKRAQDHGLGGLRDRSKGWSEVQGRFLSLQSGLFSTSGFGPRRGGALGVTLLQQTEGASCPFAIALPPANPGTIPSRVYAVDS